MMFCSIHFFCHVALNEKEKNILAFSLPATRLNCQNAAYLDFNIQIGTSKWKFVKMPARLGTDGLHCLINSRLAAINNNCSNFHWRLDECL